MKINNSISPIDIALSGLKAQGKSMEVISSNVANARTTDSGKGEPYRRVETMFKTNNKEISGVQIDDVVQDMSEFQKVYDPGNPKADSGGYIQMPNVNLPVEMMNLNIATRAYEANVAVLKRYQTMVDTTLELLR